MNPSSSALPGILIALAGFLIFTVQDTVVKLLAGDWSVIQISAFIAFGCMIPPLLWVGLGDGFGRLRTRHVKLHLTRAILAPIAGLACFYAYAHMPLADAYAIAFSMPLIITALSVPLLKEQVGWRRWSAVAVGFVGVLIMLRPGSGMFGAPAMAMLLAATVWGFVFTLIRRAPDDHPASFAIWVNLGIVVGMLPLLPFAWTTPTLGQLGIVLVGGLCGGMGYTLLALAYSKAPASIVAPFQYMQILYAAVIGLVVFGDPLPDKWTWVGTAIVVASGIYIVHRETIRRAERKGLAVVP